MEGARVEHRQMAKSNNPQFYKMFWYGIEFNNFYDFQNWRASKLSSDIRGNDLHFFPLNFSKYTESKMRCKVKANDRFYPEATTPKKL